MCLAGHQPTTLKYNQRIVEQSDVAETLVKSLTLLETDVNVKIAVLNVLQHLSEESCNQSYNIIIAQLQIISC